MAENAEDAVTSLFETLDLGGEPQAPAPVAATPETAAAEPQPVEAVPAEAKAPEQTAEEEVQTIEIDPDEPLFEHEEVENGQKITKKISLAELQRGYIGNAETQRRFQEAAKLRTEAQQEVRKAEQQAIEKATKQLDQLQSLVFASVAPELSNVDWNKLAAEDAFEYVRLSNRARQINATLEQIQAKKTQLEAASKEEQEKGHAEQWVKTVEILQKDIPGWGESIAQRLAKAAEEVGYSNAEIGQWRDPRLIKLAHKAALYDALQSKTAEVTKKLAVVPKVLKPGAAKAPQKSDEAAVARWKASKGKINQDGASVFERFIP